MKSLLLFFVVNYLLIITNNWIIKNIRNIKDIGQTFNLDSNLAEIDLWYMKKNHFLYYKKCEFEHDDLGWLLVSFTSYELCMHPRTHAPSGNVSVSFVRALSFDLRSNGRGEPGHLNISWWWWSLGRLHA